jgi:hypothetical protein
MFRHTMSAIGMACFFVKALKEKGTTPMPGSGRRQTLTAAAILCVLALAVSSASAQLSPAGDGEATAYNSGDDFFSFGTALTSSVPNGESYAGLSSTVIGVPIEGGGIGGTKGTDYLGSEAMIRAGVNTGAATPVSMAWRTRTNLEICGDHVGYTKLNGQFIQPGVGHDTGYGAATAYDSYGNVSDVVEISGIIGSYVLQMSYDDTKLYYEPCSPATTEKNLQEGGFIYLSWFDTQGKGNLPNYDQWINAADNCVAGGNAVTNYQGSFDTFKTEHKVTDSNLAAYLGSWGSDIDANLVWAVLDYNSRFAATPEPATLSLLAVGGLLVLRRRSARAV